MYSSFKRVLFIGTNHDQRREILTSCVDCKKADAAKEEAASATDFGELSPSAFTIIDWLVDKRRSLAARGRRADGVKPLDLVRQFKHNLRMGIQMAIATGSGEMFH